MDSILLDIDVLLPDLLICDLGIGLIYSWSAIALWRLPLFSLGLQLFCPHFV